MDFCTQKAYVKTKASDREEVLKLNAFQLEKNFDFHSKEINGNVFLSMK